MLIKGYLTGHEFDLLTLADLFREGEPAVAVDDQGHYLSFSAPDELFHDGGGLYDAASLLLRQVNGVARAREGDFRPVGLTGHFRDEIGQQHHVALADSAEVRGRAFHAVIATSGEQPPAPLPPPPPGPDYIQLAQVHPDVAEALEILGKPDAPLNFGDLYKVLEIVSKNVTGLPGLKGFPNLKKMGWVPPAQLEAFTASANHQGISGDQARHARMEGTPRPEKMMTLSGARQVIGALVTVWLDWLRSSSSP